jgi:hypothetical protein
MNNVFSFVANATGYTNNGIQGSQIPLTNASGTIPGPLNANLYVPFTAPDAKATCPGGGSVFVGPGVNTSFTAATLPAPVNLTAQGKLVPWAGPFLAASNSSSSNSSGTGSGGKSSSAQLSFTVISSGLMGMFGASVGCSMLLL